MSKYLDFENEKYQKGYELMKWDKATIKSNVGKRICYLLRRDYDENRGTFIVRYATIHSLRYNQVIINDYSDSIDMRDVLEAGVKITKSNN